jgi:hypothetical protein
MMLSVVLTEGHHVREETLRSVSLGNAKHLAVGQAYGFGVLLPMAATSAADLSAALRTLAHVPGVTGVLTLALRPAQGERR